MHTANTHETLRLFVRVRVATSQHGGIYKIDPPSRPPGSGAGASNAATSCHWSGLVAVDQDAKASDFKLWHDLGTGGGCLLGKPRAVQGIALFFRWVSFECCTYPHIHVYMRRYIHHFIHSLIHPPFHASIHPLLHSLRNQFIRSFFASFIS